MKSLSLESKKEPLWKRIYNELSSEVLHYQFGERFYTAEEICRKYRVSPITANRVLTEMERDGKVQKVKKKGTVVKNVRRKMDVKLVLPAGALLTKVLSNPRNMEIYSGITSCVEKLGINFAIVSEKYFSQFFAGDIKDVGFLILSELSPFMREHITKRQDIPIVLLNPATPEPSCVSIRVDRKKSTYLLVDYLISLGHRRIGFLNGQTISPWFLPRFEGYLQALEENGIPYDPNLVKETEVEITQEDEKKIDEMLSLSSPPTAIVTASDYRAINILNYCHRRGMKVPDDLSIAGDDNIHESSLTSPPLTTVERHLKKIGEKAIEYILFDNKEGFPMDIVITPELVIRQSTKERR